MKKKFGYKKMYGGFVDIFGNTKKYKYLVKKDYICTYRKGLALIRKCNNRVCYKKIQDVHELLNK